MNDHHDAADMPPVVPGTTVLIQLKEPTYRNPDGSTGRLTAVPDEKIILDRDACVNDDGEQHATTICVECLPEWALDYYVTIKGNDPQIREA